MAVNIKGYQIQETIHENGTSIVCLAVRNADNRQVVVKTLSSPYPNKKDIAKLKREFEIAEKLRGINGVIDVFSSEKYGNSNLAITMERFGVSLADFCRDNGEKFESLDRFLKVSRNIAKSLGKIHRKGIIHTNINTRNILLDELNEIRIIDYGLCCELNKERQDLFCSNRMREELPYVAPEQTGRINKNIDYRADYYALGVTLYRILTGKLPFEATSTLEWIHCHISKIPTPPSELNGTIPTAVSDIVMRLLAKNSDDRYQSSFGLIADLDKCLKQLDEHGVIEPFKVGENDVSEKFQIPDRLYGREKELAELRQAYDAVSSGHKELTLISGFSGVGKSALVYEVLKEILHKNGYLIQGKLDQFQRNTPYFGLKQAMTSMFRQILTESEERLAAWKTSILETLGPNSQILIELAPELEQIIGKQPELPELPATEAQNRFQFVFVNFVRLAATEEHPLVFFLDDLQWCDSPTLNLIERLMTSRDVSHLLIIGAYRNNEVNERHPLSLVVSQIEKTRPIHNLKLSPLSADVVKELVADTLLGTSADTDSFSQLLFNKSEGNPFFINELLHNFHNEGLIQFDTNLGEWIWDQEKISQTKMSGTVVEFVVDNMRKLAPSTQEVLKLAACAGNVFDLRTLSIINQTSTLETVNLLSEAIQHNMIIPLSEDYKFVIQEEYGQLDLEHQNTRDINPTYEFQHDRVQQAAYSLIDPQMKQQAHLSIGRLMLSHITAEEQEDRLIELVQHLNPGKELISEAAELLELAELNFRAGIKAQGASAYQAALEYLLFGEEILGSNAWIENYHLKKQFAIAVSQCSYLTGEYDESDKYIDSLLGNVRTNLEKATALSIRTRQYATIGRMEQSIKSAVQGLGLLNIEISHDPGRLALLKEAAMVRWNLGKRKIPDLINAKNLTNPEKIIAIQLLMEIFPAAFLSGSGKLFPYLIFKSVNLSLKFGNSPESAFAYAAYGMLLCGSLHKPALGYEYGKLAVAMNDQFEDIKLKSRVIYVYTMFISHWSNHWSSMTPWFIKGIEAGYQSGDLLYLAYSAQDCVIWDPTIDVNTLATEQKKYLQIVKDTGYQDSYDSGTLYLRMLLNFQGATDGLFSMNDGSFNEEQSVQGMRDRKFMTGIANYHIYKCEIYYLYENYDSALEHVRIQDRMIQSSMSLPQLVRYYLISFLTRVAMFHSFDAPEKRQTLKRLKADRKIMANWAKHCPENFRHLALIMAAELENLKGNNFAVISYYLESIDSAHKNEFHRDEALGNELLAKYYLGIGMDRAAEGYFRTARYLYYRMGMTRKVDQLEVEYSGIFNGQFEDHSKAGNEVSVESEKDLMDSDWLDVTSIMKAAGAISSEIVLDQLLTKVMQIMLENAGGQRGMFLLLKDGNLILQAAWQVDGGTELSEHLHSIIQKEDMVAPISIVNYAIRTHESVVLENPATNSQFAKDHYIASRSTKSLICIPIQRHSKFEGAIYIENNLTEGAFTKSRVEVLNLLAAQASISIENAQLYDSLESKVTERTFELSETLQDLRSTQSQLVQSEKMAGLGNLVAGVAHEINNPTNFVQLSASTLQEDLQEFKSLLFEMIGDDNDPEVVQHFQDQFKRFGAAIGNIREGTNRISTIVKDLRTFSRLDEAETKVVDLGENLDSSLRLVRAQHGNQIDFISDYTEGLELECFPAQLNQVVMNLMINACQAILDKKTLQVDDGTSKQKAGSLTIRTKQLDNEVSIEFIDTGSGMTDETKQRIFEPFFTTKAIGEGTGLGMSISYQIIEKHKGRFKIDSVVNEGTTITIFLPKTINKKNGIA